MAEKQPRLIKAVEMEQGMVVRLIRESGEAFMGDTFLDHTVVHVDVEQKAVRLARPHCNVVLAFTGCPSFVTGVEDYKINRDDSRNWLLVGEGNILNP
jgi:hypothetical protein